MKRDSDFIAQIFSLSLEGEELCETEIKLKGDKYRVIKINVGLKKKSLLHDDLSYWIDFSVRMQRNMIFFFLFFFSRKVVYLRPGHAQ